MIINFLMCVSCYTHIYIDAHPQQFSFLKNNFDGIGPWDINAQHFSPFQLVLFIFRMEYYTYTKERENMALYSGMFTMETGLLDSGLGFAVCQLGTLGKP